jgi:hypothetical protein
VLGKERVLPDPAAISDPDVLDLSRPIPPRQSRRGELRFELARADAQRVARGGGQLGVRPTGPDRIAVFAVPALLVPAPPPPPPEPR